MRPYGSALELFVTLEDLTEILRFNRIHRMGRWADKFAKVNDAMANMDVAVERDIDKLITRTAEIDKKRELTFLRKHMSLDEKVTDLAEFEKDLEDFGKNDRSSDGETSKDGNAYKVKGTPEA